MIYPYYMYKLKYYYILQQTLVSKNTKLGELLMNVKLIIIILKRMM
jgi:hypothetical protein